MQDDDDCSTEFVRKAANELEKPSTPPADAPMTTTGGVRG